MHSRMPKGRVALVALSTASAVAGCAGPQAPFSVQTQYQPIGLVLGQQQAIVTAPLAPLMLPAQAPYVPSPATPPTPSAERGPQQPGSSSPVTAPASCPPYNPIAPIAIVASQITTAPVPATYTYRSIITDIIGHKATVYAGPARVQVTQASMRNAVGDYNFRVITSVDRVVTTTTYEVVPTGVQAAGQQVPPGNVGGNPYGVAPTAAPVIASPELPGLYLSAVSSSDGSSFTPTSPIPYVQFPIHQGASYQTSGTDGTTTVSFTSTVDKQTKVNACGVPVGAWEVTLSAGSTVTKTGQNTEQDISFTRTLDVATSDGGLIVSDNYSATGTQAPNTALNLSEQFTTNDAPKVPRSSG